MNVKDMWDAKRYIDVYVLTRFFYRIGRDLIDNKTYEQIEDVLGNAHVIDEYLARTYDDDPIPFDLLEEIGCTNLIPSMAMGSKYSSALDEEKTLSIKAKRTVDEVFEFIESIGNEDIVVSVKADGVNGKVLYIFDFLELALSRARDAGNSFDYTKGLSRVLPTKLKTNSKEVKVFCETFVDPSYLNELRKLDPKRYKTPKSSAISLLLREHEAKHYKHMTSLAFGIEGVPNINTAEERFKYLESQGFKTVPWRKIPNSEIPKNKEEFGQWLFNLCEDFSNITDGLSSDGLVFEVNNLKWEELISGPYSNRNIAVKMHHWSGKKHVGKVKNIIIEQQRVEASCRIEIIPMLTDDGCTATYIQGYNPDILISMGINIGTTVEFERDSGAINKLVRDTN